MKRILFVDDDRNVLAGMRRMLHALHPDWETAFAQSGQEALDLMSRAPFDVVVSDMRMPLMDGCVLLREVMQRYPATVRIVLSGQASKSMATQWVASAHQCLSKPCDADTLKRTISRAFALRDLLGSDSLKALLSRLSSVPSKPALYTELMREIEHPDASIERIGRIIARDPGMTAKVLQLVNSPYFGLPRVISTPSHAVALLGIETLRAIVVSVSVFSKLTGERPTFAALRTLWTHTSDTVSIARQIARVERADPRREAETLMAAMLHDVGKLVLAQYFPDAYGVVLTYALQRGLPSWRAELELLHTTHAEVGAYLMGLWGLPDPIVEAIAYHHRPADSLTTGFEPLTAVHVADAWSHERTATSTSPAPEPVALEYLERVGLAGRLPDWREAAGMPNPTEMQHAGKDPVCR